MSDWRVTIVMQLNHPFAQLETYIQHCVEAEALIHVVDDVF